MGFRELFDLATRQHGAVSPACARACGISDSTYHDWVNRSGCERLFRGAVVVPGVSASPLTVITAAQLAVGGSVYAADGTAAYLHGLVRTPPSTVRLVVPSPRAARRQRGLDVRRSSTLADSDVARAQGVPTTSTARTLYDLAAVSTLDRLRSWTLAARQADARVIGELEALAARLTKAPGRAKVRTVLEDLRGDGSDSGFEFVTRRDLIARNYQPEPGQVEITTPGGVRRIDIPFLPHKVGIECLGFAYHGSREAFEEDALRSNDIAEGDEWLILRLTWRMRHERWPRFLRSFERAYRRREQALALH